MSGLARHLLAAGRPPAPPPTSGLLTAWTGVAPYPNTVVVGTVTYTNLPVVNPAALSLGQVLLLPTPGGPVVLGRLYQAT